MPIFDDPTLEPHAIAGSTYGFSAARIGDLGACEYTLVAIAADVSGSVRPFRKRIEACVKAVVESCRRSPRGDHLMLRFVTFDDAVHEVHGFRPLSACDVAGYDGSVAIGGTTALYDAACNAVQAVTAYGKDLTDHDFGVNAIVFVVTDGADNASTCTVNDVRAAFDAAVTGESVESLITVLVGVNVRDKQISRYLMDLSAKAGFTQYVELDNADAATLAKLAVFVSRSIAAQSRSLGSGGPSRLLTF